MFQRVLASILGAILCGVLLPFLYIASFGAQDDFLILVPIAGLGLLLGGFAGAFFPRCFAFILETLLGI